MPAMQTEAPPLAAGDKLSLDEFLERWEATPKIKRAELIDGIVYMPSPVNEQRGALEHHVGAWLAMYSAFTPETEDGINVTTILDGNSPQPDIHLRLLLEADGRTYVEDKLLHGAPEFVAEVCVSSAAYDLHQKKDLYEENEVYEYLAVLMYEREIRWHRLVEGRFQIMPPDNDGIWRSQFFPGLWLDGAALLAGNLAQVLEVLRKGLDAPEHAAFVTRLQQK